MGSTNVNIHNSKALLIIVLLSLSIFCLVVFLDISVVRQVFGFFYLTFIPGFVFLKILNASKLSRTETVLFSVGLSVAFLMIAGLLINEFSPILGFSKPLSLIPLMIVLNSPILIGAVLVYLKRKDVQIWKSETIAISPSILIFLSLPILSVIGAIYVNVYSNNSLLLFLILSISVLFIAGVLSKKLLSPKLYPFAVLIIAIAILFHSSLISNYIVPFASDIPGEYFLFKTTQNNAYWSSTLPSSMSIGISTYNDMLSITILPTVYATTLNFDAPFVFKILYPLIFSFVPLGLYQIWQTYIGKKYAFIAAFLFMAQMTFYTEMLGLTRQMIAELFFVLLLLVIVNKKIKPINKMMFFMVFSFALVTSHYALATIFLVFISFTLILLAVLRRPSKKITATMVVFFFVVMFTWYIYTARSATFSSILDKVNYINNQLGGFFNLASRGQTIMTGLGMTESPSIWNTVSRIFAYIVQAFIVFGFVGLVTKRKKINIEKEYFIFTVTAMAFLAMLILVPGLANTLNMTRFYHILLFFLAPLCIIGASLIVKLFSKREKKFAVYALLLFVLVPYFLFQTNFVYEVTGSYSWSIPLSGYRMDGLRLYGHEGYTDAYSVYGAQWLAKNVDVKNSQFFADERTAANVLTIHAMILGGKSSLSNVTIVADNGVVYLSTLNVVYDVVTFGQLSWNTSELSFIFDDLNLVYTNGGSEVYKKP